MACDSQCDWDTRVTPHKNTDCHHQAQTVMRKDVRVSDVFIMKGIYPTKNEVSSEKNRGNPKFRTRKNLASGVEKPQKHYYIIT